MNGDESTPDRQPAFDQLIGAPSTTYQSYLVRVWRERDDGPWRASLMHIHTRESRNFNSVEALFLYLHAQLSD